MINNLLVSEPKWGHPVKNKKKYNGGGLHV